ncbi:NAD-dependent epimerase/dehydratase family protein [Streptomyces sp. 8L]|uniref:NAD-dependent epimerase/dehydratase family protein n=1 Tax=Streptomyces sp. 8L TaxID=2877242 RepID=UPI001CD61D3A|nr:NAD(P)-dependent oxidoreductase [Streptomyces sp. 8L]MCA1220729.1 NAD(P)-dependent oxidoreductase [Streptomyces sp. 8L]
MLHDTTIVMTGATGMVGRPIATELARTNDVWAVGRFGDPEVRAVLEDAGVHTLRADLTDADLPTLPDADFVLNFAVSRTNDWDVDLDANADGLAALMYACRGARAVLHCSTTAVYQRHGHRRFAEGDPLGDNHRGGGAMFETYSISKIAAEAMARSCARRLNLPTTIARLNVPYGDHSGWPVFLLESMLADRPIFVHEDGPSEYQPIHHDDMMATLPALLAAARTPATIVNWAGDEVSSIEDWCGYLGELTGLEPKFVPTVHTLSSATCDLTRMHAPVGHTRTKWQDGLARMARARHPELTAG